MDHKIIVEIDGVNPVAVFNKAGGTERIKQFLRDELVLVAPSAIFTVDTTEPSWPGEWTEKNGWSAEHRSLGVVEVRFEGGEMFINGRKVLEYLSEKQKAGCHQGCELRKELNGEDTLPDAILDLLTREKKNPAVALYLGGFDERYPLFWSTVYRGPGGGLRVRSLYRLGGHWGWRCHWLVGHSFAGYPTLVLAPPLAA